MNTAPTAMIAEDEPLLAQALQSDLATLWPALRVLAIAGDGLSVVQLALKHLPDILFFDIRMPGQSGLEAATDLVNEWPEHKAFPMLVFVTAYDQYAVAAFDAQAVDYLLKPVQADRLAQTVDRLQKKLALRNTQAGASTIAQMDTIIGQLRALLNESTQATKPENTLQLLQASVGNQLRIVPIDQVLYLEASDKYVRVFTIDGNEVLLRTPLKELIQRLDEQVFWRIHRGSVVRASAIELLTRDEAGRLYLRLRGHSENLRVSRLYAHLFKAM